MLIIRYTRILHECYTHTHTDTHKQHVRVSNKLNDHVKESYFAARTAGSLKAIGSYLHCRHTRRAFSHIVTISLVSHTENRLQS